ncbi:MAG: site-specific integrase [Planctomycetes bacterium]|nr:site-specific integrase [Planctomycetota bacterium]
MAMSARRPIAEHVEAFLAHLAAEGACAHHRRNVRDQMTRIVRDCGLRTLSDLTREAIEAWLAARAAEGMGARTRNAHRAALVALGNWCVEVRRLSVNPLVGVPKANEAVDRRRERRALTEDELVRLLAVARERPLRDALTVRTGRHKGELTAQLRPAVRARLAATGRERALVYKTLVLTGLRKGELDSITLAQVQLDALPPHILLHAADAKNRRGERIPLRADLATDIRQWLSERGEVRPEAPLFNVPAGLVRILDRDLRAAGIPKRDALGRTVDVHGLRTTFATHLSIGGVSPATAQAAMRHSTVDLTLNVYTDPRLLNVAGALDVLPRLPLSGGTRLLPAPAPGVLAPVLAPTTRFPVPGSSHMSTEGAARDNMGGRNDKADSPAYEAENRPSGLERATRIELATFSLGS